MTRADLRHPIASRWAVRDSARSEAMLPGSWTNISNKPQTSTWSRLPGRRHPGTRERTPERSKNGYRVDRLCNRSATPMQRSRTKSEALVLLSLRLGRVLPSQRGRWCRTSRHLYEVLPVTSQLCFTSDAERADTFNCPLKWQKSCLYIVIRMIIHIHHRQPKVTPQCVVLRSR